jgi:uncharacterized SAM-binding protein YcdF (DUF218 family)
MKSRRRIVLSGIAVVVFCIFVFAFSTRILWALGNFLVNAGPPQRAEIVVVIGGDYLGNRIVTGADLVRQGYAPAVLASGSTFYGKFESDIAIDYVIGKGYPREAFRSLHYAALSTTDEAIAVVAELRRLHIHKFLLVTSPSHTARATRVFMREGKELEVHTVSAPDPYWIKGEWWKTREGRKMWFFETAKTFADFFGV